MYAGAGDTESLHVSMKKITGFLRARLKPKSAGEVIRLPQRATRAAPNEDGASKVA